MNVGPSENWTLLDLASRLGSWFFHQTFLVRRTGWELSWVCALAGVWHLGWLGCVWCRKCVLLCKMVPALVLRLPMS